MGNIKEINIKNRTYYFFDDMINIKNFYPNWLKVNKKSYKNIGIYYIGYITVKDSYYVKLRLLVKQMDIYICIYKKKMKVNI